MEAVWELLDASIAGVRLQGGAAEPASGRSAEGDDKNRRWCPQARWYDARYGPVLDMGMPDSQTVFSTVRQCVIQSDSLVNCQTVCQTQIFDSKCFNSTQQLWISISVQVASLSLHILAHSKPACHSTSLLIASQPVTARPCSQVSLRATTCYTIERHTTRSNLHTWDPEPKPETRNHKTQSLMYCTCRCTCAHMFLLALCSSYVLISPFSFGAAGAVQGTMCERFVTAPRTVCMHRSRTVGHVTVCFSHVGLYGHGRYALLMRTVGSRTAGHGQH
jgi:hypothetical protein